MTKVQTLRAFIEQRLTAAAEEIFGVFGRTISEYEEELCRQQKLLDAVFKPQVRLHRADAQQLLVDEKSDPPEQQEWRHRLNQEDPSELVQIKEEQEEQEEPWTGQDGEQLEEADVTKFTFTPVAVKSEEDEEKPQSSQPPQRRTEVHRDAEHLKTVDGEDRGGQEPDRNFPDCHLQPATCDNMLHSSEPETDDSSSDRVKTREPQSGLNPLQNNELPLSDAECNTGKMSVSSSERPPTCDHKEHLQKHNGVQTGVKPFSCSVCGKRYRWKESLTTHMRLHSEGKRFSCSVCKKSFQWRRDVVTHMRMHTGEKPFSCSVCSIRFARKEHLRRHSSVHTGEKPFSCLVCDKRFARKGHLRRHSTVHSGEKPFGCNVCDKRFTQLAYIKKHKCVGEHSSK